MKKTINRLVPLLFVGMCVYTGCAKQEVVKSDNPLPPAMSQGIAGSHAPDAPAAANEQSATVNRDEQMNSALKNNPAKPADSRTAFEKVYFNFDSWELDDTARQALVKNYSLAKQHPQSRIRIEGHCDERGSGEYNLALGERRAQAAARYLTTLGMKADRLSTISYGKEKPADPGHDESAWAKNRRDEFIVSP